MKKTFIILSLVGLLILSLRMRAMANGIYLDEMVGSIWKIETGNTPDGDSQGLILGYDYSIDKFMLNLEYSSWQDKVTDTKKNRDFNTIHFKGGYNLLQNDKCSIGATLGYYILEFDPKIFKCNYDGIMIGANAVYNFNKKSCFKTSVEYSLTGQAKAGSDKYDLTTLLFDSKYSYLFTDGFGASIGYRYSQSKEESRFILTHSGPTVGVTYQF